MTTDTEPAVQACIDRLSDSTWAYAALVGAIETGLAGSIESPRDVAEVAATTGINESLVAALLDVLITIGMARREGDRYQSNPGFGTLLRTSPDDVLAWLRSTHLQSRAMVDAARQGTLLPGWTHTDPELLQAQGRTGRASVHAFAQVFRMLPGLLERLTSPGGTVLDIGMGVGIVSIELCRIYPQLRCVGLEPGEAQAAEARRNIAGAGLEGRIEVRAQRVEELSDQDAYDLAYFPQMFMPVEAVERGLERVREALRPGGWIALAAVDAPGNDLRDTIARLRNVLWGGTPLSIDEVADLTRAAGFEMVQTGGDPGSWVKGVVGRRPFRNR